MSNNNTAYCQIIDLTANNADSWSLPIAITQGYFPTTVVQNITGWTITLTIKNLQLDAIPVFTTSVSSHVDPINGLTLISLSKTTTTTLIGWYYYYLSWVDNNGGTQTFQKGKVQFTI